MAQWSEQVPVIFDVHRWLDYLRTLPVYFSLLTLAAGIIYAFFGRSVFRLLVMVNVAAGVWAIIWPMLVEFQYGRLISIGVGILAGLLAWPMFKAAVAITAGAVGAWAAVQLWVVLGLGTQYWYVGLVIGAVLAAAMAIWLLAPVIIVATALQGSAMAVVSAAALAQRLGLDGQYVNRLLAYPRRVGIAILVLAAIGLVFQIGSTPQAGKSKELTKQ